VDVLGLAEPLSQRVQRFLTGDRLAREYPASMISPVFRHQRIDQSEDAGILALKANGFADYRLRIRGMVERPLEFSLDALRALPTRTQITRHDCVEGWA
jgi:DMSO/TMAO reductase YedYZ molybdopterin-dependent catalytic subunit